MGRGSEWTFFQRGHTYGQRLPEKMLNIREMSIKTTVRDHLTPIMMAIIK